MLEMGTGNQKEDGKKYNGRQDKMLTTMLKSV